MLLEVSGLQKWFPVREGLVVPRTVGQVKAVDGVSFGIARGEVLGLVGESGSGKTTTGRLILRLVEATGGDISFDGIDVRALKPRALRSLRRRMQIIFQDPFSSLNPHMRIGEMLHEALALHGIGGGQARVEELLALVGLGPQHASRFPHEFSGGQRQRLGIARALAVEPDFIVADEPVSALDVSIQAQVLNLIAALRRRLGLTMLFIAHDLAVVRHIADRIAVMYLGRVVELAPARDLFARPRHPYTQALLSAVPVPDPDAKRAHIILQGDIPSPMSPPSGCVFRTRCRFATADCAGEVPPLREAVAGHWSACRYDAPQMVAG